MLRPSPNVQWVNIYKMLSPDQYFTQEIQPQNQERVDYWIPGDQSHPGGIWFAFQLFWHGFGVINCVPLKVNRCRLNHVANLQQRATRRCSLLLIAAMLPGLLLVPRKRGYGEKKQKKPPTFSLICSNITLQCSTLIILYRVNFMLLPRPCLWLRVPVCICLGRGGINYRLLKRQSTFHFQKTKQKTGSSALLLIVTSLSYVWRRDLKAIMQRVTSSDCSHFLSFPTMWPHKRTFTVHKCKQMIWHC